MYPTRFDIDAIVSSAQYNPYIRHYRVRGKVVDLDVELVPEKIVKDPMRSREISIPAYYKLIISLKSATVNITEEQGEPIIQVGHNSFIFKPSLQPNRIYAERLSTLLLAFDGSVFTTHAECAAYYMQKLMEG